MTNQIFIRNMNERRVLTLLRKEGSLSRAEIARRLSLTRSGVTYLVDALLEQNLVNKAAVNPTAAHSRELGRPGVALTLNPTGHYSWVLKSVWLWCGWLLLIWRWNRCGRKQLICPSHRTRNLPSN
jgi:hypothetical protein